MMLFGLIETTRERRARLEREWQALFDMYRAAGGRDVRRPDLTNPFLITMADEEEALWFRDFKRRYDSRTGERRAYTPASDPDSPPPWRPGSAYSPTNTTPTTARPWGPDGPAGRRPEPNPRLIVTEQRGVVPGLRRKRYEP